MSPGSLYRFFRNKEEIAEALARQYAAELARVHTLAFDPAFATASAAQFIDSAIDPLVTFLLKNPAFQTASRRDRRAARIARGNSAPARYDRQSRTSGVVAVASAGLATALATGVAIGHEATLPEPVQRSGGKRFAGKAVLVTGGTSGIGRATVIAFADEGARVVFCGRREALGREVEALARSRGGDVTYRRADVRKAGEVDKLTALRSAILVVSTSRSTMPAFPSHGRSTRSRWTSSRMSRTPMCAAPSSA